MLVPCIISANSRLRKVSGRLLLAGLLTFVTNCCLAKGPDPAQSIPLEPFGFQPQMTQFLLAGSSMQTVDFVDNQHLLVTFNTKRLLKRLPECPQGDQDRVVDAVLLELPSGKLLARASWRTHDRGQYLWNLGQGHFMLRIRDALSTFAPVVNLAKGDAFLQSPFINTNRRIGGVLLSPDADLLILETLEPRSNDEELRPQEKPVQINFFRLIGMNGDEVNVHPGGALRTRVPGRIPANAAGFIAILDQGQQHWAFNFQTYGGKTKELAAFDSTCRPTPMLVSRSEFIAFGCHLSHTPQVVGAFNLRGEEMWEQNLTESYVSPTFSYAPSSGRFAFSRVITRSSLVDSDALAPELFDGQSVTVYQTDSGRQLLRVDAAPIARAGQNFTLSPDGLSLAVIRNGAVDLFRLPPLTPKEREAVQLAVSSAPQVDADPSVALASDGQSSSADPRETSQPEPSKVSGSDAQEAPPAGNAPETTGTGNAQQETTGTPAADQTDQPRKPPTLYSPGESRENSSQKQDAPR